jgi:hypothetical protein
MKEIEEDEAHEKEELHKKADARTAQEAINHWTE